MPDRSAESAAAAPAALPRTTLSAPVFVPAMLLMGALLLVCTLAPERAERFFVAGQAWVTAQFSWFFVLAVTGFVLLLVALAMSRLGDIRLGPDDARPEFSTPSWLAMLFAAGMGIGLLYFGVGEPMAHFAAPPLAEPRSDAAMREAMVNTLFHWGVHAWAIYGVVGLSLAYFGFRYELPLTLRSGLYPLLGHRIHGPWGHAVDVFALVCTVFGIATTLGYGVLQIGAGVTVLTGWDTSGSVFRLGLIGAVLVLASISAVSGLDKGVRLLSEVNLLLALGLLLFVLFTGPTQQILGAFSENLGQYLSALPALSLRTFTYEAGEKATAWFGGWTVLYWAWWISWSPFVGLFIARISRGRTVREFILGVLLVPTLFNILWMTVFGNSAIWLDLGQAAGALATQTRVDALLFDFLAWLPGVKVMAPYTVLLIALFFVTSADSGAMVVDSIASQGHAHSPVWQRLFWMAMLGLTAGLLMSAGGLKALQSMTLVAALPFALIMLALGAGLLRGLHADRLSASVGHSRASDFWNGQRWLMRLDGILREPHEDDIRRFLRETARPALAQVEAEMCRRGLDARLEHGDADAVALVVHQDGVRDFVYGVSLSPQGRPGDEGRALFEALTRFGDGQQGYRVDAMLEAELMADVLSQFERRVRLLRLRGARLYQRAPE